MFELNGHLFILFVMGIFFIYLGGAFIDKKGIKPFLFLIIGCILCSLTFIYNSPKISDQYYLPAEILFEENNHVCFTTEQGKYIVDKADLDPDTEYLLTMASNNTQDVTDDEVCVIWEVK